MLLLLLPMKNYTNAPYSRFVQRRKKERSLRVAAANNGDIGTRGCVVREGNADDVSLEND
jgi:hypothetical protein